MTQHPEFENVWQEGAEHRNRFFQGVLNFLVTSLLYALAAWWFSRVFQDIGVISWKLSWTQSTSIVTAFNFIRVWDRAFMR